MGANAGVDRTRYMHLDCIRLPCGESILQSVSSRSLQRLARILTEVSTARINDFRSWRFRSGDVVLDQDPRYVLALRKRPTMRDPGCKIVVVMPAYNAAETLDRTYRELPHDLVDLVHSGR